MAKSPEITSGNISIDAATVTPQNLAERVKSIPRNPGVYLMRDAEAAVIYVGKAKDLRARVRTYFAGGDGRVQIEYLLRRVRTVDIIITENEAQAFVLERDLISKFKPRYNIRLKDDGAYLNIRIDPHAKWPRLELVRRVEADGAEYFGPYSFSYELRNLLEIVKRVVPLRTCSDTVFYNRQRPCLEYQIKRCAGPCCLPVDRDQYGAWVKQAISILEGRTEPLILELTREMERASSDLRFEEAAIFRDRVQTLESVKNGQALTTFGGEDRDIFALYREERLAAVTLLRVRMGRIAETTNFSFSEVAIEDHALLETVVEQFYRGGREIPPEVLLSVALSGDSMLAAELRERAQRSVEIGVPERGVKARLLRLAELNARQHYISSFDAETRGVELSKELARRLGLSQVPRRIECVDISNLQGSDIVGAVVVFYDGAPERREYRKYRLSFQDKPNDFGAIYEVVLRRLERAKEEGTFPDLLIIDGGPGQLAKALEAREKAKVSLDIISLAKIRALRDQPEPRGEALKKKKPERIYREGLEEPLELDARDPVTHFVQRIRDEVHRYVITFHRQSRERRVLASALDDIPGIGPDRKRRLLRSYGSVAQLLKLSPHEISAACKVPLPVAERICAALKR